MRKFLNAIRVLLGLRPKTFTFSLPGNKTVIELEGIHCCRCQNAFWVENSALELPSYCCYCGAIFGTLNEVDNDMFEDARGSTN